ncbi:hypothetical protein QTN47_27285 [Danxiaibacter flavus]|uniref:Uncharacterized protein n=1 Tax=Danxiaibacter flavus TaxID=3049108 RepID=A0ABV3ZN73_9BACT|nr:hypothetical protein QNM32_27285 [Chitinophagaceae bacterium DXS]
MSGNLNLPLRTEVLENSLVIENAVTELIKLCMSIDKVEVRTLGNKSLTISFRNKIDLLFDLDILDKDENKLLNAVMEVRNKFLHVYNCGSFQDCVSLNENIADSFKSILKIKGRSLTEEELLEGYRLAVKTCVGIIKQKIRDRGDQLTEKVEYVQRMKNAADQLREEWKKDLKNILSNVMYRLIKHQVDEAIFEDVKSAMFEAMEKSQFHQVDMDAFSYDEFTKYLKRR